MTPNRIVVLRALGLGDLLTAVPALRSIRRAHPDARITLLTPRVLEGLARATGAVDDVLHVTGLDAALPSVLARPDVAVNLHGKGPQSHRMLRMLRPRALVAFANDAAAVVGPRWREEEHEVRRWCRLMDESGYHAHPDDLLVDVPPHAEAVAGATILHPGAKSGSRRWPVERWVSVAAAEVAAGRTVVVTGTDDERELAMGIVYRSGSPRVRALIGADVMTFAGQVAAAGRVLSGDTGVAHLATALDRPSVLLFGPMSPHLWGPLRDLDRHIVLWTGRRGDPLADTPDPGLLEIGADDVIEASARLPEPEAAPSAARMAR